MKKLSILILPLILTLISTMLIARSVILPNLDQRINHVASILSGQMEPPYQYRLLEPLVGAAFQAVISVFIKDTQIQHYLAYLFISFLTFLGIYTLFFQYLKKDFSERASIIGLLLLQIVIPLSTSGFYMEGDYITLLFFLIGLLLIRQQKWFTLPLLVILGTLNREQFIFILVWYAIFVFVNRQASSRTLIIGLACLLAWVTVYFGTRIYFGFKPTQYTIFLHIAHNTDLANLFLSIFPIWITQAAGFVILSLAAFKKSSRFHRLCFLSLAVYTALFFFYGNLWEFAKFLPAYLILIPMSLQTLTAEFPHPAS